VDENLTDAIIGHVKHSGELIDEMVRQKYLTADAIWAIRDHHVLAGEWVNFPKRETYSQWFERVFYEDLTEYRARAIEEKIGEKVNV